MLTAQELRSMGVRLTNNNIMYLINPNQELEQFMDLHYTRRMPGELQWDPKTDHAKLYTKLSEILNETDGCYLVGKGQSIDNLTPEDIENSDWPIFCVNESIQIVNELDLDNQIIFAHQDHQVYLDGLNINTICITPKNQLRRLAHQINLYYTENTVLHSTASYCVNIIKYLNYNKVILIGFDHLKNTKDIRYSSTIKRRHSAKTNNLYLSTNALKESLKDIDYSHLTILD